MPLRNELPLFNSFSLHNFKALETKTGKINTNNYKLIQIHKTHVKIKIGFSTNKTL